MLQPFNRIFGIGGKSSEKSNKDSQLDEVVKIPVKNISPNPFQPRSTFDEERIQELAQTINTHGMIQPIIVRKMDDDNYELIAGERRWRAVQILEWKTVSVIIRELNDAETASVALIENLQREELTVIEEAKAYSQLLELQSLTQEALAQRLGKSQSTIANKLRLLKLPSGVQDALLGKKITERHARALIILKNEETQLHILNDIIEKNLNVMQTEELIKQINNPPEPKTKKGPKLKGVNKDIRIAMNTIRESLNMVTNTGIDVETEEEDLEEYYQFTIKIPKKK